MQTSFLLLRGDLEFSAICLLCNVLALMSFYNSFREIIVDTDEAVIDNTMGERNVNSIAHIISSTEYMMSHVLSVVELDDSNAFILCKEFNFKSFRVKS